MKRGRMRAVSMWGHGGIRRVSIGGPERSQLRKASGVSSRQGTGIPSGESDWGDLWRKRCVQGGAGCQTIEGSWQTGSFQPEIERWPLEGCRKRIMPR